MKPRSDQLNERIAERLKSLSATQRRQLQAVLRTRRQQCDDVEAPAAAMRSPDMKSGPYILSPAQQRMWILDQLGGATAAYTLPSGFFLSPQVDVNVLEDALRFVLCRHEALCSTFFTTGDDVVWQKFRSVSTWELNRCQLKDQEAFVRFSTEDVARPFHLESDWLVRASYCSWKDGAGLILALHHIVCDGVSIERLVLELESTYQALVVGAEPVLDSIVCTYRDYVAWVHARLHSDVMKHHRDYWVNRFVDLPEPLMLPTDFPRPVVQSFDGAVVRAHFPAKDLTQFEQLCSSQNASLFMGLVAVIQILLSRYGRHNDVVIGVPVSGRVPGDFEDTVGLMVNTIALRHTVDLAVSFSSYLQGVSASILNDLEHQEFPFDQLVEELSLKRDLSRSPLFDVMLGLNDEVHGLRLGTEFATPLSIPQHTSKVDLTFHFTKGADQSLHLELEYATSLFTCERITRMASHGMVLLGQLVRHPQDPMAYVSMMDEEEQQCVLRNFACVRSVYPRTSTLVSLFREQVKRTPLLTAIHAGIQEVTYERLDALSDALATWLLEWKDMETSPVIGVMANRSVDLIVALLAILKTGRAYMPIDPETPADRVRYMLEDAGLEWVLVGDDVGSWHVDWAGQIVDLSSAIQEAPAGSALPTIETGPTDLAYIMYTSGSSGRPKGVLIEQRSVVRLVRGADFHQVREHERVLQTGSMAFDASTFEIWGPLLNGGCCCLAEGKSLLEVEAFGDLLQAYRVDTMFLTTGLFNQLAEFNIDAFRQLKTVLTGGEKVSVLHMNRLRETVPHLRLLHVYGPTENTTFSSWYDVDRQHKNDIPIGGPIANSEIYILDEFLEPVPHNVPGDIYCAGDGLARGYLGRPDLTSHAFIPHPFSSESGTRMYRTGDVGYWNEHGDIVFLGRDDDQVKIRGFRIELGEIETQLRAISGVENAVVCARQAGGTHELVAYLLAGAEVKDPVQIREALRVVLPTYMVPTHIMFLDAIPLTPTGKVNRRALPAPGEQVTDVAEEERPEGSVESVVAGVWANVLGMHAVGRTQNFFSLGGDSIKAIQCVAKMRDDGIQIRLADLFLYPTVAELALHAQVESPLDIDVVEVLTRAPLAPIQHWWLACPGTPVDHFNQATILQSAEALEETRIRQCLDAIVQRHPALTLTYRAAEQEEPASQVIDPDRTYAYRYLDVSGEQLEEQLSHQTEFVTFLHGEIRWLDGPFMVVGHIRRSDGDRLVWIIHHWVVDGVSWRILIDDFEAMYTAKVDPNMALPVRVESIPFTNWCHRLADAETLACFASSLPFWQAMATRCQSSDDGCRRRIRTDIARESVDRDTTRTVRTGALACYQMNAHEVILVAFARAWRAMTGCCDVVVAMERHGREPCVDRIDCSQTVGWFTSMFPCVLHVPDGDLAHQCRAIKDDVRSIPDQGFGYGVLRYLSSDETVRASLACSPLISFNYLGHFQTKVDGGLFSACDEPTGSEHDAASPEPFLLDVLAVVEADVLQLTIQGDASTILPEGESVGSLAAAWKRQVLEIVQHGETASPRLSASDCSAQQVTNAQLDTVATFGATEGQRPIDVLPLTPMQTGMVYHADVLGDRVAYSDQVCLRIEGPLDASSFRLAWAGLVARHEGLRVSMHMDGFDEPVQVVWDRRELDFSYIDGSVWGEAEREQQVLSVRARERKREFDLQRDPLVRIVLIHFTPNEHELILGFHHVAIDGWSSGLLMYELQQIYLSEPSLGPAPRLHTYYNWLQTQTMADARTYWQHLLAGYTGRAEWPTAKPRFGDSASAPHDVAYEVPEEHVAAVRAWLGEQGLTFNSFVQSLWGILLGYLMGRLDVVFGATVSGRPPAVPGVESLVGMLINTLPVRVEADEQECFLDVVKRVQQQFHASQEHAYLGLADIQTLSEVGSDLITHTLVFENYPESEPTSEIGWRCETVEVFDPMHYELGVLVVPRGDGLTLRFVADANLYPTSYLRMIGDTFAACVAQLACDPRLLVETLRGTLPLPSERAWTLSSTFTADSLAATWHFWASGFGRPISVASTGYNQVLQALVDVGSPLGQRPDGRHVLLFRQVDWAAHADEFEENLDLFVDAIRSYVHRCPRAKILVVPCPDTSCEGDRLSQLTKRLQRRLKALVSVDVLAVHDVSAHYEVASTYAPYAEEIGGLPYTDDYFSALATELYRRVDLDQRPPIKVIVVDADNTLWRGIVGEDGVAGLSFDAAHLVLQQRLVEARQAGCLVCVVSKNNRCDIESVFAERSELRLSLEDLVEIRADWRPKSEHVAELTESLGLGPDTFLFIDDSPMECAEIRQHCPEVCVVQLPSEEMRVSLFSHCWLLDAEARTDEDHRRTDMYREDLSRRTFESESPSRVEFLRALNVVVEVGEATPADRVRVAQLTQRTNQFNTTTIRRTEEELEVWVGGAGHTLFVARVQDRFGDYGLAGALFLMRMSKDTWRLENMLLSCRALSRGVEHTMLAEVADKVGAAGGTTLVVDVNPSGRNQPAIEFLESISLDTIEGQYTFDVDALGELAFEDSHTQTPKPASQTDILAQNHKRLWGSAYVEIAEQVGITGQLHRAVQKRMGILPVCELGPPPETDAERRLVEIWEEVLGIDGVGRTAHFFTLGGHSLKAVMLLSRLQHRYGVQLQLEDVVEVPVLHEMALRCTNVGSDDMPALVRVPVAESYPLSHAQRRLWMLEHMRGEGPSPFHMVGCFRVDGPVDATRLRAAMARVFDRHASLRTAIRMVENEPRQVICDHSPWALNTSVNPISIDSFKVEVKEAVRRPFDLSEPPLVRILLRPLTSGETGLCIVLHHVVGDGWSVGVLANELNTYYAEVGTDPDTVETELPVHYVDYAVWQSAYLASAYGRRDRAFWLETFSTVPDVLELPTDFPRPPIKKTFGASIQFEVSATDWGGLGETCQRLGLTPFTGLFGAMHLLLRLYTEQKDLVMGTPIAGRSHPDLEGQIGFYVNVVPVRAQVDDAWSVEKYLHHVGSQIRDALQHQDYPFDCLVDDLSLERDTSRAPLFDVLVVLQNAPMKDLYFDGAAIRPLTLESHSSQYDLTLNVFDHNGGAWIVMEYDASLFRASTVNRLAANLATLIASMGGDSSVAVGDILGLSAEEQRALVSFEGDRGEPAEETMPELVARWADATPAKAALADADGSLTYAELHGQVVRLATDLASRIPTGAVVGILGERSVQTFVAMLAVMRAGGVYLPLDPENPEERLRFIIDDAEARLLLVSTQALLERGRHLVGPRGEVIPVHEPVTSGDGKLPIVRPDQPAYLIYTSGSTGQPKGVLVHHQAFCTMIRAQSEAFGVTQEDVVGQFASPAFDASLSECFLAFSVGATLHVAPTAAKQDVERFEQWIAEASIDVLTLTPAFLRGLNGAPPARLRTLITAGEAADPALTAQCAKLMRVFNAYGPTETSVCATVAEIPADKPVGSDVPIGRPLACTMVRVLDASGKRLPIGVPGELWISGPTVAARYYDQPEKTAECFVPDPFGPPGDVAYRTGDRCCWRDDGTLSFLGRRDDQIKVRGYRVELGEIEANLRLVDGVCDAVVSMQADGRLVAYCETEMRDESPIRSALQAALPAYMMPHGFVLQDQLAHTSTGKIDRTCLPRLRDHLTYEAPELPEERALALAWEQVLGVDRVGRSDPFFALGGDSIKALLVVSHLREKGWLITLQALFASPRLCDAATSLRRLEPEGDLVAPTVGTLPLLPIQRWFFSTHPSSPYAHFNQAMVLLHEARINRIALRQAVQLLVDAHDVLRARFRLDDKGTWQQELGSEVDLDKVTVYEDWTLHDSGTCDEKWDAFDRELNDSFLLEDGPLIRVAVVSEPSADHLVLLAHHLVVDGVSWRILMQDIMTLYQACTSGPHLSTLTNTHGLAAWAACMVDGLDPAERDAWQALRTQCSAAVDGGLCPGVHADVEVLHHTFTAESTMAIRAAGQRLGNVGVREFMLTSWVLAAHDVLNWTRIPIALEGHGRMGADAQGHDLSRTVGWFTSMYPLLIDLTGMDGEIEPVQLLRHVTAQLANPPAEASSYLRCFPDEQVPAMVSFNYLGSFDESSKGGPFRISPRSLTSTVAPLFERDFVLDVAGHEVEGCLTVQLAYPRDNTDALHPQLLFSVWTRCLQCLLDLSQQVEPAERLPSCLTDCSLSIETLRELATSRQSAINDVVPMNDFQCEMVAQYMDGRYYQEQVVLRVPVPVDPQKLRESLQAWVQAHVALRTTFYFREEVYVQILWETVPLSLSFTSTALDKASEWAQVEFETPLDVESGPAWRVKVLNHGSDGATILFTFHHALLDGWSLGRILPEWEQMYDEGSQSEMLHAPSSGCAEYLRRGGAWRQSPHAYQRAMQAVESACSCHSYAELLGRIPMGQALSAEREQLGLSINTVVEMAFGAALIRSRSLKDGRFVTLHAGRSPSVSGVGEMVGMFLNVSVVDAVMLHDVRELLERGQSYQAERVQVQEKAAGGLPEAEGHWLSPAEVGVLFVFENYPMAPSQDENLRTGWRTVHVRERFPCQLHITVLPMGGCLEVCIRYDESSIDAQCVETLQEHVRQLLSADPEPAAET